MGLSFKSKAGPVPEPEPGSLIASAVRMGLSEEAWRGYRFSDEAWQRQAWDFYDTNSQLHNAVDYIGAAASMIRIYVAEVDENGVRQGEVDNDDEIGALAESLFGGPANKAEMLRGIAESLTVAGECFIIGKSKRGGMSDQWWVAAPGEVRKNGDTVYVNMGRAVREELTGNDIIIRTWTPHPRRAYLADSPVRALLGLLYEMEQMQMFIRAQMNSRIANATILPVPSTLAVPKGDNQAVATDDIYQQLFEVITSNLEGKGTAAQVAPILWQMPLAELTAMSGVQPIRFDSPLSDQAIELRKEQQQKLAIGMNVPVEIQLGGQEMNHWSIWWAGEEFIVKTMQPLFNRIVDALTTAYLVGALRALGKDPARYTYWYDTAPLANSANKLADALNLYSAPGGPIVSAATVRREGGYNDADAPTQDEINERFIKEVILRDPTLFAITPIREEINIDIDTAVPGLTDVGPPPPPVPGRVPTEPAPGQQPAQPAVTDGGEGQLIASAAAPPPTAVAIAANGLVVRALELAGKRLLTPTHRGVFGTTPPHLLHTKILVGSSAHAETLLAGAWDQWEHYFAGVHAPRPKLQPLLHSYCKGLLTNRIEHSPTLLAAMLQEARSR